MFRATGPSAQLTLSDWASPADAGGPAGQELMFNYLQVQPCFEEDKTPERCPPGQTGRPLSRRNAPLTARRYRDSSPWLWNPSAARFGVNPVCSTYWEDNSV